jgi:hypothetical protein
MSVNPYQVPAAADESDLSGMPVGLRDLLDSHQRKNATRGTRIIWIGYTIFLVSFIASRAQIIALPDAKLITGALISVSGLGLLVSLIGVSCFLSLSGTAHKLALLAVMLQTLSMLAMLAFVSVLLSGRPVSGLFKLFGASSLATLLTSQAIVALIIRRWVAGLRLNTARQACDSSVIGLALCAALNSSVALRAIPGSGDAITHAITIAGMCAAALLLFAIYRLIGALNRLAQVAITDEADPIDP